MNILIKPSVATGEINAPPSKSVAHRLLICAALSENKSVIENIGTNDDIAATIDCLKSLGADIKLSGNKAYVKGISTKNKMLESNLFCNESGSTLRFLIPLSLVFSEKTIFTGKGRLLERPQDVFQELFKEKGCFLGKGENCLICSGELKSGVFRLPGNVSSQFITGLLFALPLLDGDSEIVLTTELESSPYIDITIDVLNKFGIVITKTDNGYFIKGSQKYIAKNLYVEGDWSNSAFLDAFNLIGGSVQVNGMNKESYQGDKAYVSFYSELKNGVPVIDISDCPDLGPVLIACASLLNGATLKGTKRLKIKESDRGEAMREELTKFGIDIFIKDNEICIPDKELSAPSEPLNCHNDHRIAMALSIICSRVGGTLMNAECVNKSYPEFFDDIKSLGIQYEIV